MRMQLSYRDHIITPDGNKCSCGLTGWFHDSPLSAIPPFATLIIEVCFSPQDEVETESHVQLDVIDGFCIFRKNITVRQNEATSTTTVPITAETITTEGPETTAQTTSATTSENGHTIDTDIPGVSLSPLATRAISGSAVVVAIAVLAVLAIFIVGFVVYRNKKGHCNKKGQLDISRTSEVEGPQTPAP